MSQFAAIVSAIACSWAMISSQAVDGLVVAGALGDALQELVARDLHVLGRVAVARVAAGLLAAHHVERHLRERADDAGQLPDGRRRGAVRLAAAPSSAARAPPSRSCGARAPARISGSSVVEIIPSSMRSTFCSIACASSRCLISWSLMVLTVPPRIGRQLEAAELAAEEGRAAAESGLVRLEHVDEAGERRAVVQLVADDVERHADSAGRASVVPCVPVMRLRTPISGGSRPPAAPDVPDSVELAHRTLGFRAVPGPNIPFPPMEAELVRELPEGDGWQYEPKWDGFRGVLENAGGELALWSRNERPLLRYFPELRPLGELLPPRLGARRRDRDRARRRARLRRDADAAPSGRVADPQAVGGDPGRVRRLRRAALGRRAGVGAAARGAARAGRGARAASGSRRRRATLGEARGVARRGSRRSGSTASSRSGSACRTCRARATASSRSRSTRRPTASSSASAGRATARRSRRCCSASTATTAGSTTSARARSPRRRASEVAERVLPLLDETRRTGASRSRTAGGRASSRRRPCGRSSSSRCATTRCRATASATARSSCAGARTRIPRDCTWRELRPPRDPNAPGVESLLAQR